MDEDNNKKTFFWPDEDDWDDFVDTLDIPIGVKRFNYFKAIRDSLNSKITKACYPNEEEIIKERNRLSKLVRAFGKGLSKLRKKNKLYSTENIQRQLEKGLENYAKTKMI